MRTTVHNFRREATRSGDVRIDRRTEFGNGFVPGSDDRRVEVIEKFEKAERARLADPVMGPARRARVRVLYGKRLFRWCAELPCHRHVLARLAAELVKEEEGRAGKG